jgi:hypothetical protein
MTSNGYTVTEHLVANGTGTDGSLYYTGQLAKNGSTYDYTIIVCNDPVTADSHFSSSVSFVQQLGFSSSYSNDGSSWTGTMLYNGVPIGAGVTGRRVLRRERDTDGTANSYAISTTNTNARSNGNTERA